MKTRDTSSHHIWFHLLNDDADLHLEVNGLERAQQVWDRLRAGGFVLRSRRPEER